ncbi:MAG TPA: hypothetical protein DEX20_00810 [Halieaceae bacterium]|nr:hypothetical protein [Halieaceae bacterium]
MSLIDTVEGDPKRSDVNTPFQITLGISVGKQADTKDVLSNTRHVFRWSQLTSIRVGFTFFGMALVLDAAAASIKEEGPTRDLVGKTRLTSTEITRLFSDVIDRGEVQNERGISAETHWHADGTFVSRWWTQANPASDANDSGTVKKVTGWWRAEHDLRCVTFDSGTQPDWSCAEVWLLDDGRILSLNPDRSAHGLHRLSPLK